MAEVKFRLNEEFTQGLGFKEPFDFMVEETITGPDGRKYNINNSDFPRNDAEKQMIMSEIFKRGNKIQQNTGTFPTGAMEFLSIHAGQGASGKAEAEIRKVMETTQRMYEDPIGTKSALMKFEGQQTPYKTDFMKSQERISNIPVIGGGVAMATAIPNLFAQGLIPTVAQAWIPGDEGGGLPQNLDNIVEDAITFAKRRLPTDLQQSGRMGTIIAADLGLIFALRKANIQSPWHPAYQNFLGKKVIDGLNKVQGSGVVGTTATVGGVSGAASAAYDMTYSWVNRMYRDANPVKFETKENGEFKLDKQGNKIPMQPPITEDVLAALQTAQYEALFSGGAAASIGMGGKLWKNFIKKGTGFGREGARDAQKIGELAEQYDVPMSIIAATPSEAVKGYARIIGIFPFVGGPLRQSQDASKMAINRELEKTFLELAPYQKTLDTTQGLSEQAYKALKENFENFSAMKAIKYEAYDDVAEQITEPFIPTARLKDYISSITGQKRTGVPLQSGQYINNRHVSTVKEAFDNFGVDDSTTAMEALKVLGQLPDHLTAKDFRELQFLINSKINKLNTATGGVTQGSQDAVSKMLASISKNLRSDLDDTMNWKPMSGKNQILAEIGKKRLEDANGFFFANRDDFASIFEGAGTTRVGKLVETKVDQRVFQPGAPKAPGEIQIDQIFDEIMNSDVIQTSLKAQEEMYRQFGPKAFKSLTRGWLDKQISKYTTVYNVPTIQQRNVNFIEQAVGDVTTKKRMEGVPGALFEAQPGVSAGIPIIDVEGLRTALGLTKNIPNMGGMEARSTSLAMENMFKLMGPEGKNAYKKIDDLLTLAERTQSFDVADVSSFVQRRGVLGGAKAAAGAFTFGMGIANPISALGTVLLARGMSRYLTSPKAFKNLMTGLDDSVSPALRRNAIFEVVRLIDDQVGFDSTKGQVSTSPIMVGDTEDRYIVREAPEGEGARRDAKKKILGVEEYYGKKLDALTVPEVLDYFVHNTNLLQNKAHASTVKLGIDPKTGQVVTLSKGGGQGGTEFDQQQQMLKNIDPTKKLATDIFGSDGNTVSDYAKVQVAKDNLASMQGALQGQTGLVTEQNIVPRAGRDAVTREMYTPTNQPNPFLTGMGKAFNFMTGNTPNQIANQRAMEQSAIYPYLPTNLAKQGLSKGKNIIGGLFNNATNANQLNQAQRQALASGNLDAALAARGSVNRFNKGGIANIKRKVL
tara:strand:- start:321 stop:3950 length:3630 start_codon:yes stop_codon:yes gene_type:complete